MHRDSNALRNQMLRGDRFTAKVEPVRVLELPLIAAGRCEYGKHQFATES